MDEIFVWVEPELPFCGYSHFIVAEWHLPDDMPSERFGTVVLSGLEPSQIEDAFPTFQSHADACAALRRWVDGQGAL